jgi:hypothetical protein
MREFPARPKGTLMSGAFRNGTEAERALRVLKNAGYARAEVVQDSEAVPGTPIVIVIDAAVTAAFRAAEILEEHGADVTYDSEPPVAPPAKPAETPKAKPAVALPPLSERKPRVRKRARLEPQVPSVPNLPRDDADVVIVTRGIESIAR